MADDQANPLPRRALLTGALLGAASAAVSGCTRSRRPADEPRAAASPISADGRSVLLAYFSPAGENYWNGGRRRLTVGNTQVVAETIGRLIECRVHRIEAADP